MGCEAAASNLGMSVLDKFRDWRGRTDGTHKRSCKQIGATSKTHGTLHVDLSKINVDLWRLFYLLTVDFCNISNSAKKVFPKPGAKTFVQSQCVSLWDVTMLYNLLHVVETRAPFRFAGCQKSYYYKRLIFSGLVKQFQKKASEPY